MACRESRRALRALTAEPTVLLERIRLVRVPCRAHASLLDITSGPVQGLDTVPLSVRSSMSPQPDVNGEE